MITDSSSSPRSRLIFEGRSKRLYETTTPGEVLMEFKTNFPPSATEREIKGHCAAKVAEHLMKYLHSFHVETAFVKAGGPGELVMQRVEVLPIALIVRNFAAGGFLRRFGVEEGSELQYPVFEFYYRNSELGNPIINETHIAALGIAKLDEVKLLMRIATKANAVLRSFAERRRLKLVDFWLEFGRRGEDLVVADAIEPDCARFVDMENGFLYDGYQYRMHVGDYYDSYMALYKRLVG